MAQSSSGCATGLASAPAVEHTRPLPRTRRWSLSSVISGRAGDLLVLPALAASALVYFAITRNYFFADDFLNLYNISNYSLLRYLITPNGGHLLVVRNAIFYLTYLLAGTHPEPYYWSVLLVHLVNVWLLFRVIRTFTGSAHLASFGAALWGTSPLNEGALGWYSVFGHVLVATALLIILDQAGAVAARGGVPSRAMRALWYALALAAATSFGVGISVALTLPVALWLLLPQWRARRRLPPLIFLVVVIPVLYVVLTWVYIHVSADETVARAPWAKLLDDWRGIAVIFARLMGFGLTRLVLGAYQPTWLGFTAWYAGLAAFGLLVAAALAGAADEVRRRVAAIGLLLLACYGMIAAGRAALLLMAPHDMISTLFRYHYVGQLLFTVLLCLLLACISGLPGWLKHAALTVWYAVMLTLYALLAVPIDTHADARAATQRALAEMVAAIRAQPPGSPVTLPNLSFKPLPWYPAVFPGRAAAFVIFFPSNVFEGRQVSFAEPNRHVIEVTSVGRRTAGLLVPVPPPPAQSRPAPNASMAPPLAGERGQ